MSETRTGTPAAPKQPVVLARSALIVGICAFVTGLVPWLGLLLGIAAIVLGLFALARRQSRPMAIAGMALGAPALVTGLVVTIGFMALIANGLLS